MDSRLYLVMHEAALVRITIEAAIKMNESSQIRRAVVADAAQIARLAAELGYPATVSEISLRLSALLPSPAQFIAVAERAGSLLGWVAAERRLLLESGEKIEIVGLVVGANERRSGLGKSLVTAIEQWAATQKISVITVRSNVVRTESHPFYERIGYKRKKTQHAYEKQLVV